MAKLNSRFLELPPYFFSRIEERTRGRADLINLGVGDVRGPLSPYLIETLREAANEYGKQETFYGYPPAFGYPFLRNKIQAVEYAHLGIESEEIFISNGIKNDLGQLQDLFEVGSTIAIPDPTYPAVKDASIMSGKNVLSVGLTPPQEHYDAAYLCTPSNPTSHGLSRRMLQAWVEDAREKKAILWIDGAYDSFIRSPDVPYSVYEIPGAASCAIELKSFSKRAGFTNLRCSFAVVPKQLGLVHEMWKRRVSTKTGGVPYPVQKAALRTYDADVQAWMKEEVQAVFRRLDKLAALFPHHESGIDAPYLWVPGSFEEVLEKGVIAIPGEGFGPSGKGYLRFSGFATDSEVNQAILALSSPR